MEFTVAAATKFPTVKYKIHTLILTMLRNMTISNLIHY